MLSISPEKIYVYTDPVDMRKAINGLSIILLESFERNPQAGDLYLFVNRARNKVKGLFWDKNGFVLYYKRLERGRFNYSKHLNGVEIEISEKQLSALLLGLDFHLIDNDTANYFKDFF